MNNYKAGSSYAYKLFGPWVYRDVLHDIYVNHHKKTGENVFTDRSNTFLIQAIKWYRNDYWGSKRTIRKTFAGRHYKYIYPEHIEPQVRDVPYSEMPDDTSFDFEQQDMVDHVVNFIVEQIKKTKSDNAAPETTLQILSYLLKGYKVKDIVKETGRSSQSIDYHVKKIRTLWTCAIKPGNSCLKKTLT